MINENDIFNILIALERTNQGNIGALVTIAHIKDLVKKLINSRLDLMAQEADNG